MNHNNATQPALPPDRDALRLWQHEETGRMVWHSNPGSRWIEVPVMLEDELPASMTDEEYDVWCEASRSVDGTRIGPVVATRDRRSGLRDIVMWALFAMAITAVFGTVLNFLEAWL